MGFDKPEIIDDADSGGGKKLSKSSVSCSICLEPVAENGDRSRAKLQCGHEFHLDCIGSAFNIKGAMQCPNCRKIEKGQWLFATGCCSFTDVSFEDWPHDEDFYDLGYPEMSFGVQWCPVTAFPRLPSFEEGEFPSSPYHDLLGQHALFPEHTAVTSTTHACPYLAYYEPIHSSSSITVGNVSNGSSFNTHWGGPSGPSEMPPSYSFATMDPHYQIWDHHSLPFSTTGIHLAVPDQPLFPSGSPRSSRINTSFPRSGSFIPPFIPNHSQYPGSAARARDRALALQAYFQPPMRTPVMANTRRSNGHGGLPPSSSDQAGGFYLFRSGRLSPNYPELEIPVTSRFHSWERDHPANFPLSLFERDPNWGGFHPSTIGSGSFRHRHVLPQNRLRS